MRPGVGAAAREQPLGPASFLLLAVVLIFGLGFLSFPRDLAATPLAVWPAFLLTTAGDIAGVGATIALSERMPALRLASAYPRVLGLVAGTAAAAAVAVFDAALATVMLRQMADQVNGMFLYSTPFPALVAIATLAAGYAAQPGVQAIARSLPILMAAVLALGLLLAPLVLPELLYAFAIFPRAFPARAGASGALHSA